LLKKARNILGTWAWYQPKKGKRRRKRSSLGDVTYMLFLEAESSRSLPRASS